MKHFNLNVVAACAGITAALFGAAPAHAYTYATSALNITGLTLGISPTATIDSFQFDLRNTATLNGVSTIQTATCNSTASCNGGVSPVLDAAPANAPGSAPIRANNDFSFLGFSGATNYSNSDSVITTATVVQGVPTATQQISESLLTGSGNAAASTLVQSNTTLTFQLTLGPGFSTLSLSFNADPDLEAAISSLTSGTFSAQASHSANFTLTNNGTGEQVTWSPTGAVGNQCFGTIGTSTCTETADSLNLNTNVATGTNNTDVQKNFEPGVLLSAFGINITGLQQGNYSLSLAAGTSTSISQTIPEPGSTALVGLALAGLAFSTRYRFGRQS